MVRNNPIENCLELRDATDRVAILPRIILELAGAHALPGLEPRPLQTHRRTYLHLGNQAQAGRPRIDRWRNSPRYAAFVGRSV
jgi:hypothetical protein